VLEIDNDEQHDYDHYDIDFLTGFSNVLAEAVATAARTTVLLATIEQMKGMVEEKEQLQEQKEVLVEELQHRVRNNLQLVSGMLSKQWDDNESANKAGQRGIEAIARRVSALAQVLRPSGRRRDDAYDRFRQIREIALRQPGGNSKFAKRRRNADLRERRALA
jgi:two-component sensor histidine kinase